LKRALLIAAGLAMLFASYMLWIALSHNPQYEFYGSELGVNWEGIATLWGMSFIAAFAILVIVFFIVPLLVMGIIRICLGDTFFARNNAPTIDDLRQHFLSEEEQKIVRRESKGL